MKVGGHEKPVKTPEELAQIAFLDDLRFGRGEEKPGCTKSASTAHLWNML